VYDTVLLKLAKFNNPGSGLLRHEKSVREELRVSSVSLGNRKTECRKSLNTHKKVCSFVTGCVCFSRKFKKLIKCH